MVPGSGPGAGRLPPRAPARRADGGPGTRPGRPLPALRRGGRRGGARPGTAATFARWRSPWFFLERAEDYAEAFRQAGFAVPFARIEAASTRSTPEQVLADFESGAAAGYLDAAHYEGGFPEGYPEAFRRIAAEAFRRAVGPDGQVELVFHRVYLLAVVPG